MTVMSERLAAKLQPALRIEDRVMLSGPDKDSEIPALFCKHVAIELGDREYGWHLFIANIKDDLILGLDFVINFEIDLKL